MVTKKASVKKKAVTKKKATTHKRQPKGSTLLGPSPRYTSFKVNRDIKFMNIRITKQTIYWSILLLFILVMQLWILNTQLDVLQTLNALT